VRHVAEHVEPRDALLAEQRHGVRVGLLEDRRDQVAGLDLVLLGALRVVQRVLHHAMEGERLARALLALGQHLEVLVEEALQRALERRDVGARMAQHLGTARIVKQRVQQVLDGEIGVAARQRLAVGGLQGELQLASDPAHPPYSFSMPARSG
jgi:hypothetical protein